LFCSITDIDDGAATNTNINTANANSNFDDSAAHTDTIDYIINKSQDNVANISYDGLSHELDASVHNNTPNLGSNQYSNSNENDPKSIKKSIASW